MKKVRAYYLHKEGNPFGYGDKDEYQTHTTHVPPDWDKDTIIQKAKDAAGENHEFMGFVFVNDTYEKGVITRK